MRWSFTVHETSCFFDVPIFFILFFFFDVALTVVSDVAEIYVFRFIVLTNYPIRKLVLYHVR